MPAVFPSRDAALAAGALALLMALPGLGVAQPAREGSGSVVYTCVDAQGRTLTADRPIAACADREQRVLGPTGTVIRTLGPTLSAREQAEREERERQAQQAQLRAQEERRRMRALLIRYPTPVVHERERAEALHQVDVVIQAARKRLEELAETRTKLDGELEFYGRDVSKAPDSLKRQIDDNTYSANVQKRFIGEQEEEKRRVNARFDEERAQLVKLWPPATAKDTAKQ